MQKEYLREKDITYEEIQVDTDHSGLEEMIRLSGQLGVPFTVVDKERGPTYILGFDKMKLDASLGVN